MAGITYVSGRIRTILEDTLTNVLDLVTLTSAHNKTYTQTWTTGTGANQQQISWSDTVTISNGGTLLLDLSTTATAGGAVHCNNGMGDCNFAKVKQILINVATLTTGYKITIGGGDTPLALFDNASDKLPIKAGGHFTYIDPVDGITVTSATDDLLLIANPSAGSVTFDIFISGTGSIV